MTGGGHPIARAGLGIGEADILQRIRARINDAPLPAEYMLDEAAAEIERLRKDLCEARCRQRVSIIDQGGAEVGHRFASLRELTVEEAFRDSFGTIWTIPTAWAYFAVCRAHRQPKPIENPRQQLSDPDECMSGWDLTEQPSPFPRKGRK